MIERIDRQFMLHTAHTTYCFQVLPTGHLEHLYYGRRITLPEGEGVEALVEKHTFAPGNTNLYNRENTHFHWRTSGWRCPPTEKAISGSPLWR